MQLQTQQAMEKIEAFVSSSLRTKNLRSLVSHTTQFYESATVEFRLGPAQCALLLLLFIILWLCFVSISLDDYKRHISLHSIPNGATNKPSFAVLRTNPVSFFLSTSLICVATRLASNMRTIFNVNI